MTDRYFVFDVETPNFRNDRMSAIGVALVEQGRITDTFSTLINPECRFDRFNIELTGITPESVRGAPIFPEVWQQLAPMAQGRILVAHNAPFDMSVLAKCLQFYGVESAPILPYLCTCQMGRRCLPQMPNHKLNTLCDCLGIALEHHRADSDALACAQILLYCLAQGADCAPFVRKYDIRRLCTCRP